MQRIRVGVIILLATFCHIAGASDLPALKVDNIRRVFHNGEHNAFTDLIQFRNRFYLTFRSSPDGHGVNPNSRIIVLSSSDGRVWKMVHQFSVPGRDVRDPHFLVFQDKLFIYSGTWYCGDSAPKSYDMNQHLGYGVWSSDGAKWSQPEMLEGTYGHYIWRAASHGSKAYLCGRRKQSFTEQDSGRGGSNVVEAALLESIDGLRWKTAGFFRKEFGNETAFLFEPDGELLALCRGGGKGKAEAYVCRSRAPFDDWERIALDRYIGGPMLVKWNGHYLAAGRQVTSGKPITTLWWLHDNRLHQIAQLPSGGDNSYSGFAQVGKKRALISWYSTHEKSENGKPFTAIYLADLIME